MVAKGRILVVDDEQLICWSLKKDLTKEGYEVLTAESFEAAKKIFEEETPDVALLDVRLPDGSGMDLLKIIKQTSPFTGVIMVTANDDVRTAVECMQAGAYTYLRKPVEFDELILNVQKVLEESRLQRKMGHWESIVKQRYDYQNIVAESPAMKKVMTLLEQVIQSEASTVLFEGESGTGKDLLACTLHYAGKRSKKEFVSINCAALPEALLESELFGHERGAFTDARQSKRGLVEEAEGGTLFLDEIGDMQKGLQAKLLHLIDQKKFRKVGGTKEIAADIRIITATNKDLKKEVAEGRFREDLFYRLNVIGIYLPPLRERAEDIPALVYFFIRLFNERFKSNIQKVHPAAMEMLTRYAWPGNVRELKNVIERAIILNHGDEIRAENLPGEIDCTCALKQCEGNMANAASKKVPSCLVGMSLTEIENQVVLQTLEASKGNQSQAARMLGIGRDALRYKLQKIQESSLQNLQPVSEKTQS